MILVDGRAGSCELIEPLAAAGLPVEEDTLPFGDVAFMGRGIQGVPLFIILEHKKLPDLVQSLTSERLAGHQLVGMVDPVIYDRQYLIIEGIWDHDDRGRVIVPHKRLKHKWDVLKGAPPAQEMVKRVINLETRGGLRVCWTPRQRETVRYISALYRYWTDKDLDKHRSHLAVHSPDLDAALRTPVSDFRRGLIGLCPGIGLSVSRAIEQRVWDHVKGEGSWRRLMPLTIEELADIDIADDKGAKRRLGPARARKLREALV